MLISNYFPHKHPSVHMTQVLSQKRLPAMLLWMGNLYCMRSGKSRRCVWCLLLPTGTCPCLTRLLNCLFWSLKLCHDDHPWAAGFRGSFIPVSCLCLKQAVSLCKLHGEGNKEVERPQFFTESHQRETLTPASWLRHGKVAKERWPAQGCETHRAKTTTHTCSMGSKLLTRGKNSQRNAYVVWYDNKCLHFRMLSVKQGQVEPKHYLFHIHSKSLSDYKAWMMTNTRQNKTKPQILMESAGWIAVTSTSVQTDRSYRSPQGSWDRTLHPGQQPIRNSSPKTNAFFFFLVWGFWAVQGFAHNLPAAVFFLM